MNLVLKISLAILSGLMLIHLSCYRDVIDLDLEDIGSQVAIEGIITDLSGPYTVKISKPVDFERAGEFRPISGAEVIITDDSGNSETLQEGRDGYYQTHNLQGIPGKTYFLNVSIEGTEYTASSTMPEAIELDSIGDISYVYTNNIICTFTDPAGVKNYCRLKVFRNGQLVYTYLYQDRYSDGQQIVIDDIEINFYRGDHVEIQFLTIEKAIFEYFEMLLEYSETKNDAPATLVTLYNPKTNLRNNALGYFSAHTLRRYIFVVQ